MKAKRTKKGKVKVTMTPEQAELIHEALENVTERELRKILDNSGTLVNKEDTESAMNELYNTLENIREDK